MKLRRPAANQGAPWAARHPDDEQPSLAPGKNWVDRLSPIMNTPTYWGDNLRARTRPPGEPRLLLWAGVWAVAAVTAFATGHPWFGASATIMALWALVLKRFSRVPRWTWLVVLLLVVAFVAPFDWLLAPKAAHHAEHALAAYRRARSVG